MYGMECEIRKVENGLDKSAFQVYYEQCVETTKHFAWFPQTPTGANEHSIVEKAGHCVANASPAGPTTPKYLCKADGKWDLLDGACRCDRGFLASDKDQTCTGESTLLFPLSLSRVVPCRVGLGAYRQRPTLADCSPGVRYAFSSHSRSRRPPVTNASEGDVRAVTCDLPPSGDRN